MTTKYPRPCEGCDRLMRPNSKSSTQEKYPTTETTHHARGKCKACSAREHYKLTHLTGQKIRKYDRADQGLMKQPLPTTILTRLAEVHPPTAHYIQDRRRRGIPTTGKQRKATQ